MSENNNMKYFEIIIKIILWVCGFCNIHRMNTKGDNIAMQKVRKAVIPAAGFGTRFLPATKAMAKEMWPIVDKPTIQFIVEEAIASGIEEILIVTGKS